MSHYFTHYWTNRTWNYERQINKEGDPLDHIASNLFVKRGISPGDMVYVVTVMQGVLYVLSKIEVAKVCAVEEAAQDLGCTPDELWVASDHIIAAAFTPMRFDNIVPIDVTERLLFIRGNDVQLLVFASPGVLDQQTLRGVRRLTPESAAELDHLLPSMTRKSLRKRTDQPYNPEISPFPEEVANPQQYYEGSVRRITVNAYERNRKARQLCLDYYGTSCAVCNFDFEAVYGEVGRGFTHVHHLIPLSEIGEEYELNPIADLCPVCPNCHAMIHRKNPPYTIAEMRTIVQT